MLCCMKGNKAAWEAGKVAMFVDFTLVTIKKSRNILRPSTGQWGKGVGIQQRHLGRQRTVKTSERPTETSKDNTPSVSKGFSRLSSLHYAPAPPLGLRK